MIGASSFLRERIEFEVYLSQRFESIATMSLTLEEILSNEELRQHEFPVCREKVFLAHAGVCAIPRRVASAISDYAFQSTLGDQETLAPAFTLDKTRELAARLINADPSEMALVGPTSLALSYIASGVNFRKGDNVVVYFDDYPSNVYPWMALAHKGVKVRFITTRRYGVIEPFDVIGQVDENTRLVALASCHYISGYRIDIKTIGDYLRSRGVLFCLDAIQTVGAFPTPSKHVDFMAADAHKWMLGPCAAGLMFVRKDVQKELKPPIYGWHNVECPGFIAQSEMKYASHGKRYEVGSANLLGVVGMNACMEMLLEIGIDKISNELIRKKLFLKKAIESKGYKVLGTYDKPNTWGGMISCIHPDKKMEEVFENLEKNGIIASLRGNRDGKQFLRFSPHFYNTDAELIRAADCLL